MSDFRKQHMSIEWHEIIDRESETPAINAALPEKASLVGRVGLTLLTTGIGAWRVRASMNKVARALGITCVADIGLLAISYTCVEGKESVTTTLSINTTGVNTDKIHYMRILTDSFAEDVHKYSVEQFHSILDKIAGMPGHYSALNLGLASGLACCAFTFLLGGGPFEMICAFFGAGIGNFVRKKLLEHHITLFANVAVGVSAACLVYVGLISLLQAIFNIPEVHQAGYICSMLFVIPGFPLICGGIDLAKLDMRSGLERVTYGLLIIIVATLTGWVLALAVKFQPQDFQAYELNKWLLLLFRLIASFCGVYGFSLMFNSPRKMAVVAGLIGMIANTTRLTLIDFTGIPAPTGAFFGALMSGLLASFLKTRVGYPRITMTVPSIVIMVPGMFMYKGIYYIGLNDVGTGALWLCRAVLIVTALPLGLICARILTDKNFRKSS